MKIWLGLGLAILTGCGQLIPMKRSEQEGMKANQTIATEHELTVRRVVEPVIGNGLTWSNGALPMRQDLEIHDRATVAGQSHEEAKGWYKQTVPLWVSLIGLGVGILIFFFAIKYARKSSPAVDAAWGAADNAVAGVIRNLRAKAVASTDAEELARLNGHIAELEGDRGRMRKT